VSKRRRFSLLLFLPNLASLSLVACGSGGESEEEKVETAIREAVKGEDPSICTEGETAALREQVSKESGKDAIKLCEEEKTAGASSVKTLNLTKVVAEDETATANVAFIGGNLDGQTVTMSLVKGDEDQWQVDEMLAFKNFDRRALLSAYREALTQSAETPAEEEFGSCVVNQLEFEDDKQLQEVVLNPKDSFFKLVLEVCGE
jgi:hypothetical protein